MCVKVCVFKKSVCERERVKKAAKHVRYLLLDAKVRFDENPAGGAAPGDNPIKRKKSVKH